MWNQIEECVEGVKTFAKDSGRFLSVCDKPDTAGN